jgi:hypothetical protein
VQLVGFEYYPWGRGFELASDEVAMTLSTILFLLWHALYPQMYPFPGPKNAATGPTKTIVQGCGNGTAGTSITCTFGSAITAGNMLYLCVGQNFSVGSLTWSGDFSDTFVDDPGSSSAINQKTWNTNSNGWQVSCKYVASAHGGGTSITASGTRAGNSVQIVGIELHNVSTLDKSDNGSASNSIGGTATSASITPTNNGELLIGVCMNTSNVVISAGSNVSWSLISNASPQLDPPYAALESYIQPTAGAVTAQCNLASSIGYWAHIVAFN